MIKASDKLSTNAKFQNLQDLNSRIFKYFQAPYLFSNTFKGLEVFIPNSSIFKDFSSTLWTLTLISNESSTKHYGIWQVNSTDWGHKHTLLRSYQWHSVRRMTGTRHRAAEQTAAQTEQSLAWTRSAQSDRCYRRRSPSRDYPSPGQPPSSPLHTASGSPYLQRSATRTSCRITAAPSWMSSCISTSGMSDYVPLNSAFPMGKFRPHIINSPWTHNLRSQTVSWSVQLCLQGLRLGSNHTQIGNAVLSSNMPHSSNMGVM